MLSEDSGASECAVAPACNRSLEKIETDPDATVGNISATEEVVSRELGSLECSFSFPALLLDALESTHCIHPVIFPCVYL